MAMPFCLMLIYFAANVLPLADAGKDCSWTSFVDKQISGGQQVDAGNLSACQAACEQSKDCEGIDFDRASNNCFLLQTKSGMLSKPGITHYNYDCQTCFWTYYANKQVPGGKQVSANNLPDCQTACVNTRYCQGVDFDTKLKKCFLINTRERAVPYTGIDHYDYNCVVCSWTYYEDHHISGGDPVSAATLSDCKLACEQAEYCQGVDFEDASESCFLLKTKFGQSPYSGVGHYDYNCQTCFWTYYADRQISGGQQMPASNLSDCQDECLETGSCQSIDFDPKASKCFLLNTTYTKVPSTGIDHYDQNCYACSWTYFPDQQIWGGQQVSVENLSDCLAACMKQGYCRSVDYDGKSNSCFLIKTKDGKLNAPGIQHYDFNCQTKPTRDSCSWRYFPGQKVSGGEPVEISDVGDCQDACVQRGDCQSIDFDTDTKKCFLLKYKDDKVQSTVVNHYDYNCQTCFWTYFADHQIFGGQQVRAAELSDCQEACEQRGDCQGLDFEKTSKNCFLHTNKDNRILAIGIDHYDYSCFDCSWNYFADKQISGGQQVTAAGNLKDCQTSCKLSGSCRSIDFDVKKNNCFLLKTNTDPKVPAPGIDHYDFSCHACEWTYFADKHVSGGKQVSAANLADCQAACLRTGDCQSVDFHRITKKCFLLKTKDPKEFFLGIDHYDYTCPDACDWTYFPDQQIIGGKQKMVKDLRECLFACVKTGGCLGADYEKKTNNCFLLNTRDGKKSAPGIDHYEFDCLISEESDSGLGLNVTIQVGAAIGIGA